jgi:hypothetical protein
MGGENGHIALGGIGTSGISEQYAMYHLTRLFFTKMAVSKSGGMLLLFIPGRQAKTTAVLNLLLAVF